MTTHVIQLDRYCAKAEGVRGRLVLGTWQSYGLEQLKLVLGDGWAGRTVTAVFHGPRASIGTTVLAGSDGLVDVPQEATAAAGRGAITIMGVDADSQRISVDVPYMVIGHSPVTGQQPDPTPDIWQQFVAKVKADADRAEQAAGAAADSAAAAAKSAEAAAESAKQAEQAGADIGAAKDDALEAIQQAQDTGVQAVEGATTTGVQVVQQAHQDAIDDIATDRQQALADIEDVGDKQQSAITSSGAAVLEAIGQTEQAAIGQVEQAGTAQVAAVETAGQAQLDKINAANALVPTPTQADAGKAIIVKPDGSGYELGEVQTDAYTKTESDARYAPIAAAIRPTVSGNPATLEHSVAWAMQGMNVYGKSTQDGEPSPDNPVPIVSAGNGGKIEVIVTGRNLCPYGTKEFDSYLDEPFGYYLPAGTYTFSALVDSDDQEYNVSLVYFFDTQARQGVVSGALKRDVRRSITLNAPRRFNAIYLYSSVGAAQSEGKRATFSDIQLEVGSTANPYESHKSQSMSILIPNGLPGIPVDSGGNYTDAIGQQWVCDEVDFGRGVYVQQIGRVVVDGTESWTKLSSVDNGYQLDLSLSGLPTGVDGRGMCNYFTYNNGTSDNTFLVLSNGELMRFYGAYSTLDAWKAFIAQCQSDGIPLKAYYALANPIETPLSEEQLAAYAALHTYDGTTVVATDAPVAGLSARYVADGAAYIDGKIQSALAPVHQAVLEAKTNV